MCWRHTAAIPFYSVSMLVQLTRLIVPYLWVWLLVCSENGFVKPVRGCVWNRGLLVPASRQSLLISPEGNCFLWPAGKPGVKLWGEQPDLFGFLHKNGGSFLFVTYLFYHFFTDWNVLIVHVFIDFWMNTVLLVAQHCLYIFIYL